MATTNNWIQHRPAILCYQGKYVDNWFSNMKPSKFTTGTDQFVFETVEHFYQAMKSNNALEFWCIAQADTPYTAKKLGKIVKKPFEHFLNTVNPLNGEKVLSIEEAKLMVMEIGLIYKFEIPEWREKLVATGDSILVEWNTHKDVFWGADATTGKGLNHLGRLLMKIRKTI